jgi:hypothetical protein
MIRRSIAAVMSLALVAVAVPARPAAAAGIALPAGFSFPLSAASDTQGTFNGTLHILNFAAKDGQLFATGIVTGTLVDENGATSAIVRTVSLPVNTGATTRAAAPASAAAVSCDVLHLDLGPLDLDLLGLVVHLDEVVLDLTAVPGAGNLLGNLLCAITNLLNGGGALTQIAGLLNQVLDLLS